MGSCSVSHGVVFQFQRWLLGGCVKEVREDGSCQSEQFHDGTLAREGRVFLHQSFHDLVSAFLHFLCGGQLHGAVSMLRGHTYSIHYLGTVLKLLYTLFALVVLWFLGSSVSLAQEQQPARDWVIYPDQGAYTVAVRGGTGGTASFSCDRTRTTTTCLSTTPLGGNDSVTIGSLSTTTGRRWSYSWLNSVSAVHAPVGGTYTLVRSAATVCDDANDAGLTVTSPRVNEVRFALGGTPSDWGQFIHAGQTVRTDWRLLLADATTTLPRYNVRMTWNANPIVATSNTCSELGGSIDVTPDVVPTPGQVVGLSSSVSTSGAGGWLLSWRSVSGAERYFLDWSSDESTWHALDNTTATSYRWTYSNVPPYIRHVRVRAWNASGTGPWSASLRLVRSPPATPLPTPRPTPTPRATPRSGDDDETTERQTTRLLGGLGTIGDTLTGAFFLSTPADPCEPGDLNALSALVAGVRCSLQSLSGLQSALDALQSQFVVHNTHDPCNPDADINLLSQIKAFLECVRGWGDPVAGSSTAWCDRTGGNILAQIYLSIRCLIDTVEAQTLSIGGTAAVPTTSAAWCERTGSNVFAQTYISLRCLLSQFTLSNATPCTPDPSLNAFSRFLAHLRCIQSWGDPVVESPVVEWCDRDPANALHQVYVALRCLIETVADLDLSVGDITIPDITLPDITIPGTGPVASSNTAWCDRTANNVFHQLYLSLRCALTQFEVSNAKNPCDPSSDLNALSKLVAGLQCIRGWGSEVEPSATVAWCDRTANNLFHQIYLSLRCLQSQFEISNAHNPCMVDSTFNVLSRILAWLQCVRGWGDPVEVTEVPWCDRAANNLLQQIYLRIRCELVVENQHNPCTPSDDAGWLSKLLAWLQCMRGWGDMPELDGVAFCDAAPSNLFVGIYYSLRCLQDKDAVIIDADDVTIDGGGPEDPPDIPDPIIDPEEVDGRPRLGLGAVGTVVTLPVPADLVRCIVWYFGLRAVGLALRLWRWVS